VIAKREERSGRGAEVEQEQDLENLYIKNPIEITREQEGAGDEQELRKLKSTLISEKKELRAEVGTKENHFVIHLHKLHHSGRTF